MVRRSRYHIHTMECGCVREIYDRGYSTQKYCDKHKKQKEADEGTKE